jgi:hypothetical protein
MEGANHGIPFGEGEGGGAIGGAVDDSWASRASKLGRAPVACNAEAELPLRPYPALIFALRLNVAGGKIVSFAC